MRTKLSPSFQEKQKALEQVFTFLETRLPKDVYFSLWTEERKSERSVITSKSQTCTENLRRGSVLRAFNGLTVFEEATESFEPIKLIEIAQNLVNRVLKAKEKGEPYRAVSWSERLQAPLDDEIRSQITGVPKSEDWVVFGTRYSQEPFQNKKEALEYAGLVFEKLKTKDPGIQPDYLSVVVLDELDQFLFMDTQVRMAQSLKRGFARLIAVKDGERAVQTTGGLGGCEVQTLTDHDFTEVYRKLSDLRKAERLTPGRYSMVMHPDVTGVFAHEAFGHTQEGDTWLRGRSKAKELYLNRTQVGNQHATILNNPAVFQNGAEGSGAWGSYFFDEEGWFPTAQELVREGYLQTPMTNLQTSHRLKMPRTANGKRECWSNGMYVRQTNTYFSPGDKTFTELITQMKNGFYAEDSFGGMEDPKGMGIQVGISHLYEVKDGKMTGRVFKGPNGGAVQMTGYVPDYLFSIRDKSKIAADSKEKENLKHPYNAPGGCAKYHKEVVHAGCGGPYLLVDSVLLG